MEVIFRTQSSLGRNNLVDSTTPAQYFFWVGGWQLSSYLLGFLLIKYPLDILLVGNVCIAYSYGSVGVVDIQHINQLGS